MEESNAGKRGHKGYGKDKTKKSCNGRNNVNFTQDDDDDVKMAESNGDKELFADSGTISTTVNPVKSEVKLTKSNPELFKLSNTAYKGT